jgi:hypothetical protein
LRKRFNMPFYTIINVAQGADCSEFTITDASTYGLEATSTFSARKLTILKSDGTYLKVNGITYNQYVWPFSAGNTLTLNGTDSTTHVAFIDKDYAFNITLALTSNSPQSGSIYTKTELIVLVCYIMSAFFANTNKMAINTGLEKDYRFIKDVMRLFLEQESAKKAGVDGDLGASQSCLDRGKFISDALKIGY